MENLWNIEGYKYKEFIEKVYKYNKRIENFLSLCVLVGVLSAGALLAKVFGAGNLAEYSFQALVGLNLVGFVIYRKECVIKSLDDKDSLRGIKGFNVKVGGGCRKYEVSKRVYNTNDEIKGDLKDLNRRKLKVILNKVTFTFLIYGLGVYIIDVGSFDVSYVYQMLMIMVSYGIMMLFYKGDSIWNVRDVEEIVGKVLIRTGMGMYKEDSLLETEGYWEDIYLDLYYRKEVLFEKGDLIREKENLIARGSKRDEYWDWSADIRRYLKNIESNTSKVYCEGKGDFMWNIKMNG